MSTITIQKARAHFKSMSRGDVVSYLESWGIACFSEETVKELREAAAEQAVSEGGYHHASRYQ